MSHSKVIVEGGVPLRHAKKALVVLHGRGGDAHDMLALASHLPVNEFYIAAPQATHHTWYPFSFMAAIQQNEPWLSSALNIIKELCNDIRGQGIAAENIYLLGFSQGACLTAEFAARNAQRYGGIVAFTGGLVGERFDATRYEGNFASTPVLLTNGNNDPHVPLLRSEQSKQQFESMQANVTLRIYPNRPHTILPEELQLASTLLKK